MKNVWLTRVLTFLVVALSLGPASLVAGHAVATSVTIVNNSSREIRHVYLSPTNQENWGPDQLDPATIAPGGGSYTLNVTCNNANIKVIAEDQEGCFLYQVVTCGVTSTWTISNDSVRDCGN